MSAPRDDERKGRFLGLPYNLRRPSWARIRLRVWDPQSRKLWVPKAFGWGYSINLAEAARRLHLRRGSA
jgi:hypothetical protein